MEKIESHHHRSRITNITNETREIVFGLSDGLVSTLGAITGIASATYSSFFVILSGCIVIAVEALSMGAGEYLSSKSEQEVWKKRMEEERKEIREEPKREREELAEFYREKGLKENEVQQVTNLVMQHPEWVLEEMAVHELHISPVQPTSPLRGAFFMFFAYILGGLVPLFPYFFVPIEQSLTYSIAGTAIALFGVGALKARFTTGKWFKGGFEMMGISLAAAVLGYGVGQIVSRYTT